MSRLRRLRCTLRDALANPELTVLVFGSDGDMLSIGAGHLPHAAARNVDLTVICMDNQTYGLTKAQASLTSEVGQKSRSTPHGVIAHPVNPVLQVLTHSATFVARAYSAKPNQLVDVIVKGINHKGFAFIHVRAPALSSTTPMTTTIRRLQRFPRAGT